LYLLGLHLYRRRQLETAGSAITFDVLRPFFKYGVTFCFMLLLGSYFYETQNSMGWTYFGYLLGSLPAYFGVEILLHKSLHVFKPKIIKGYGIYALIMIICIGALHLDFTGYERRLPELVEVESVYMDNAFYPLSYLNEGDKRRIIEYQGVDMNLGTPTPLKNPLSVYTQADNIANIYALHQKIVDNRAVEKAVMSDRYSTISDTRRSFYLVYNLKNGSRIYRKYRINPSDYAQQLKPIYESYEYKNFHNAIMGVNPSEIKMIEINAERTNKSVRIVDQKLIQQAVAALQSDIIKQTYEEIIARRPGWAYINILLENNKTTALEWKKSYVDFEQWLKNIDEYDNARLIARDDLQYAIVTKQTGAGNEAMEIYKRTKMSPKQYLMLETCLRQYTYPYPQPYSVIFLLKNGDSFIGGFAEADAPAFVKEHFAR